MNNIEPITAFICSILRSHDITLHHITLHYMNNLDVTYDRYIIIMYNNYYFSSLVQRQINAMMRIILFQPYNYYDIVCRFNILHDSR